MKVRVLGILLVLSLAFNLAFALGFLHARQQLARLQTPEGRWEALVSELELTEAQQREASVIRARGLSRLLPLRDRHNADLVAFWDEMMADEPDAERVREIVERTSDATNEARRVRAELTRQLMLVFTPEQRQKYREIAQRMNPALRPQD